MENSKEKKDNIIRENIMGTMPINKLVLTISLPMVISMMVQALYNVVDSVFVAQLNENALTAVSLAFPIQNLMIAVGVGTGVGMNALLSKSLGAKEYNTANKAALNGIFLAIISTLFFVVFGLFFSEIFMESQTSNAQIIKYGVEYLQVCSIFSIGICGQLILEKTLQATGKTFYSMISQTVGAVTNIILDPILIFGLFGMPRLEVKGAAIATVIGQIIGMLFALYYNVSKNKEIDFTTVKNFKPSSKIIGNIYSVGVPSIMMQSVSSIMVFAINKIIIGYTDTASAVFGIYFKIQSFVFMPVFGLNNAMTPILSYNYGAKNKQRIIQTIKVCMKYTLAIMILGTIIFQFFPGQLMTIFKSTPEMDEIAITSFRIISLGFILAGFSIIFVSTFQAFGHGVKSLIISVTRQLVILVPSAMLLSIFTKNLSAIWWAFPVSEVFTLALSIVFFKTVYNKEIKNL